jgi:hypothetical protein
LTQVEFVGGVWFSFRVGFSPGELVDFILGWTTLDIFGGDTASRKRTAESAQEPAEPDNDPPSSESNAMIPSSNSLAR